MVMIHENPRAFGSSAASTLSFESRNTPPSSRRSSEVEDYETARTHSTPYTPPESSWGSPEVKPEDSLAKPDNFHASDSLPVRLRAADAYADTIPTAETLPTKLRAADAPVSRGSAEELPRLPSMGDFLEGVKALGRSYGAPPAWEAPSAPSLPRLSTALQEQRSLPPLQPHAPQHQYPQSPQYSHPDPYNYQGYPMADHHMHDYTNLGYPSPPPEQGDQRHCNKKYSVEEGDFIIYAWHDKKQKWHTIKKDFARIFGTTPERTIQGLQAWYYRMNLRIPVWDRDGYLIFNNEDDIEPRTTTIKCRDRDAAHRQDPMGLAQRYPERLIHYAWVDPEIKRKARDWAIKRTTQYQDRRERRKRKEQRRSSRL